MAKLLGLSAQLEGDLQQAEEAFLAAQMLDRSDPEPPFFLGRLYYDQNFFDKAKMALETACKAKSPHVDARRYLALTLEALGDADQAARYYAEAASLEKEGSRFWMLHLNYGSLLHKLGRIEQGENELKLARDLKPDHWQPRFELAKLYHATSRSKDAITELDAALETGTAGDDVDRIRSLLATVRAAASRGEEPRAAVGRDESSFVPIAFANIANVAGVRFVMRNHPTPQKHLIETMPGGIAVFDYDNDGFEDLYFTNGAAIPALEKTGPEYWNRLYRNKGDGTFADVTGRAGVAGAGYSMAAASGDYDNDGRQDLFVAGVNRNLLYRNNGDGTFTDITLKSGIKGAGKDKMWSIAAGWFDYDNDGLLDLFVVNYCKWAPDKEPYCGDPGGSYRTYCHPRLYEGLPNTLYHNNGDGTFSDVSAESGIAAHIGKGMAVAFADYDDDGRIDAFVTNDATPNFLFRNLGGGKFEEVGLNAGIAYNADGRASSSMGVDFRDFDNDGKPDVIVTALSNETFSLFRNAGNGQFEDTTYASGLALLTLPWSGWGAGFFDFNNDGWKDIFTANSHALDNQELLSSRTYRQSNLVLGNMSGSRFVDGRSGSAKEVWTARAHRGSAFGDFDNDGRMDVAVSSLNDSAELLRNTSDPRQHWLQLRLAGRRSNRDAIGARIRIVLPSGRTQHNHVTTSVGYASSSSKRVHFGLGAEREVRRIEIRWPSGTLQVLEDVQGDRLLEVAEP